MVSFIEWFFQASSPLQSDETLAYQEEQLQKFNQLKNVFADVSPSRLNFPKMHSLVHVAESTRWFGTADNADTEITEHQHRVEVKLPYRRTNKREPLPQVVKFVERRTALEEKLDAMGMASLTRTKCPQINHKYRQLSSLIPEGRITILEASKLFTLKNLELAVQNFFHDIQYSKGKGHHRVSRKKLLKLKDCKVIISCTRTRLRSSP